MIETTTETDAMSWCLCCKTEFVFTIESGGLCDLCNEGDCPRCVEDPVYG